MFQSKHLIYDSTTYKSPPDMSIMKWYTYKCEPVLSYFSSNCHNLHWEKNVCTFLKYLFLAEISWCFFFLVKYVFKNVNPSTICVNNIHNNLLYIAQTFSHITFGNIAISFINSTRRSVNIRTVWKTKQYFNQAPMGHTGVLLG